MDVQLLFDQYTSFGLTLISPTLFELEDSKKVLLFHDEERADLFFIHLNEFINTTFMSPLQPKIKTTLFDLMRDFCVRYKDNSEFQSFLSIIDDTKEFFFKKRYYKYYISPHDIVFDISFAELINIQSNNSKHSFYHLTRMKEKLKGFFKKNKIPNYEEENYNDHLQYFQEAVLDDRLNFNQTHMVQKLGELFLAFWELINSNQQARIQHLTREFIRKHGRLTQKKIKKPNDLSAVEDFFWDIKGLRRFDRNRLSDYIPETWGRLIEMETSIENLIEKHK